MMRCSRGNQVIFANDNTIKIVKLSDQIDCDNDVMTLQLGDKDCPVKILDIFNEGFQNNWNVVLQLADNSIAFSKLIYNENKKIFHLEKQIVFPMSQSLITNFITVQCVTLLDLSISYIVDKRGVLSLYRRGQLISQIDLSQTDDEYAQLSQPPEIKLIKISKNSLIGKSSQRNSYFKFDKQISQGEVIQHIQLRENDPCDLDNIVKMQECQEYMFCFTLSRLVIAHQNVLKLIDINTGQLISKHFTQFEIYKVFAFELNIYVVLVDKENYVNPLYQLSKDESQLTHIKTVQGSLEKLYLTNECCIVLYNKSRANNNNEDSIQVLRLCPSYSNQDLTPHFKDMKQFSLLDYYHYPQTDRAAEKLIFYNTITYELVLMEFDKLLQLKNSRIFKLNSTYHQIIHQIIQIDENDENLYFSTEYQTDSIFKYDMKKQEIQKQVYLRNYQQAHFQESIVYHFNTQNGLTYQSINNYIKQGDQLQSYNQHAIDPKISLYRDVQFSHYKLGYITNITDKKNANPSSQDILRILPQPQLNFILPFGIQNSNFEHVYMFKKIDNKVTIFTESRNLITFNYQTGHHIKTVKIDDSILTHVGRHSLGQISEVTDMSSTNQKDLGKQLNSVSSSGSAVKLFRDYSYKGFNLESPEMKDTEYFKEKYLFKIIEIGNEDTTQIIKPPRIRIYRHLNKKVHLKNRKKYKKNIINQIISLFVKDMLTKLQQESCKQPIQSQDEHNISLDQVIHGFSLGRTKSQSRNRAYEMIEYSFNHYYFSLYEKLMSNKKMFYELSDYDIQHLLLSIFPDGNTLLHLFANNNKILDDIQIMLSKNQKSKQNNFQDLNEQQKNVQFIFIRNSEVATIESFDEDYPYKSIQVSAIPDQNEIDNIFAINQLQDQGTQKDINIKICDIPSIHLYSEQTSVRLFHKISVYSKLELFKLDIIQALIQYKWDQARKYTLLWLFIPFLIYHGAFIAYSNVFNGQVSYQNDEGKSNGDNMKNGQIALAVILYVLSVYFLTNEIRQVINNGVEYFFSVWNYIDVLPIILIIIVISSHLSQQYNEDNNEPYNFLITIHSVASLLMWLKLLYFLRLFQSTGYLVRTIIAVIYEMRIFLLILAIVYCGFGEAFLRLAEPMEDEETGKFVTNFANAFVYIYRMSLVDNNTDSFEMNKQSTTIWILFVLAGIILPIIMLNLLIAIISLSFEKINEQAELAAFQEKARIIYENHYLIPGYVKRQLDDKNKFLGIVSDLTAIKEGNNDSVLQEIQTLKEQVTSFQQDLKSEINDKFSLVIRQQEEMKLKFTESQNETREILAKVSNDLETIIKNKK
eukprot:403353636